MDIDPQEIDEHIKKHYPNYFRALRGGVKKEINFAFAKCLNFGPRDDYDSKYNVVWGFFMFDEGVKNNLLFNPNFNIESIQDGFDSTFLDFSVVELRTEAYMKEHTGGDENGRSIR